MLKDSEKLAILNEILTDPAFESEHFQKLLGYLVKCSISNKPPNEVEIAQQIFKRQSFDPAEDSIVRVYAYKLRKKLKDYYAGPGESDKVQIQIPKGHYQVEFFEKPELQKNSINNYFQTLSKRELSLAVILLLLFVFVVIQFFITKPHGTVVSDATSIPVSEKSQIWSDYFNNSLTTNLVIGDYFMFREYDPTTNRYRGIIDYAITQQTEFENFIRQHGARKFQPAVVHDLPHNSIFNLHSLSKVFFASGKDYHIRMSSDYPFSELIGRNIVFLGTFRHMRRLELLTRVLPYDVLYDSTPENVFPWYGTIVVKNEQGEAIDSLITHKEQDGTATNSVGIVAKLKGPNQENYLIFSYIGYSAAIEIVKAFADMERLVEIEKQIQDKYQHIPEQFVLFFDVPSFSQIGYKLDLKHILKVKKQFHITDKKR